MATRYWLGTATAVAQVTTVQITAYDAATTYTITVGSGDRTHAVSVVGNTDVNTTASDLDAAWDAATHPYCTGVTATVSTDTVTLTADTAGVPFTVASSVTGGTGTIGAATTSTASAGPSDWSTADNWSDGTVPVSTDDVIVADSANDIAYGLAQSAVTLASLRVRKSFTGRIGLRQLEFATTVDGRTTDSSKPEYRTDYLDIGADVIDIGEDFGPTNPAGSGRIKVDNAKAGASTLTVHDTAQTSADTGLPSVRYLAAHADADVYVRAAPSSFGIAVDKPDETATVGDVSVSAENTLSFVEVGSGTTITSFSQKGGRNVLEAANNPTTVTVEGGILTTEGDYGITTLNSYDGLCNMNHVRSSGDEVTTCNLDGGEVNAQGSTQAQTIATVNLTRGRLRGNSSLAITTLNEPTTKDYVLEVS